MVLTFIKGLIEKEDLQKKEEDERGGRKRVKEEGRREEG